MSLIQDKLPNQIHRDDRLLFFFSGHGHTLKNYRDGSPSGFIVPYDGNINKTSLIEFDEIVKKSVQNILAKHILFLMDCCFSGISALRSIDIDKLHIPSMPSNEFIDYCSSLDTVQIITAGGEMELVLDKSVYSGHSPFTGSIIHGITTEEADLLKDGILTATELGTYLTREVSNVANIYGHKQKPIMNRLPGDKGGDFVITIFKENVDETLEDFKFRISQMSLKQKVELIKDETKSNVISLLEEDKIISISYITFTNNLKDLQLELMNIIKTIGRMFSPKNKYMISIQSDEILLSSTAGLDFSEKLSVNIASQFMNQFITKKIELKSFWKELKFYKKIPDINSIKIVDINLPLLI